MATQVLIIVWDPMSKIGLYVPKDGRYFSAQGYTLRHGALCAKILYEEIVDFYPDYHEAKVASEDEVNFYLGLLGLNSLDGMSLVEESPE